MVEVWYLLTLEDYLVSSSSIRINMIISSLLSTIFNLIWYLLNINYKQNILFFFCLLKWHRFFMILTWSMTIAAFVIIFVELGEWSSETIHASLGLATTILVFIQPFMAAARPHPGAPRRSLFNWVHWFVGNAAHICSSKFF